MTGVVWGNFSSRVTVDQDFTDLKAASSDLSYLVLRGYDWTTDDECYWLVTDQGAAATELTFMRNRPITRVLISDDGQVIVFTEFYFVTTPESLDGQQTSYTYEISHLYVSVDGGASFTQLFVEYLSCLAPWGEHIDVSPRIADMVLYPDGSTLLLATGPTPAWLVNGYPYMDYGVEWESWPPGTVQTQVPSIPVLGGCILTGSPAGGTASFTVIPGTQKTPYAYTIDHVAFIGPLDEWVAIGLDPTGTYLMASSSLTSLASVPTSVSGQIYEYHWSYDTNIEYSFTASETHAVPNAVTYIRAIANNFAIVFMDNSDTGLLTTVDGGATFSPVSLSIEGHPDLELFPFRGSDAGFAISPSGDYIVSRAALWPDRNYLALSETQGATWALIQSPYELIDPTRENDIALLFVGDDGTVLYATSREAIDDPYTEYGGYIWGPYIQYMWHEKCQGQTAWQYKPDTNFNWTQEFDASSTWVEVIEDDATIIPCSGNT